LGGWWGGGGGGGWWFGGGKNGETGRGEIEKTTPPASGRTNAKAAGRPTSRFTRTRAPQSTSISTTGKGASAKTTGKRQKETKKDLSFAGWEKVIKKSPNKKQKAKNRRPTDGGREKRKSRGKREHTSAGLWKGSHRKKSIDRGSGLGRSEEMTRHRGLL